MRCGGPCAHQMAGFLWHVCQGSRHVWTGVSVRLPKQKRRSCPLHNGNSFTRQRWGAGDDLPHPHLFQPLLECSAPFPLSFCISCFLGLGPFPSRPPSPGSLPFVLQAQFRHHCLWGDFLGLRFELSAPSLPPQFSDRAHHSAPSSPVGPQTGLPVALLIMSSSRI